MGRRVWGDLINGARLAAMALVLSGLGCSDSERGEPLGPAPDAGVGFSELPTGGPTELPEPELPGDDAEAEATTDEGGPVANDAGEGEADEGGEPEVAPGCPDGSACNDGDPCTFNDQCTGGVCAGTAVDCNDDLPCTTDLCEAGVCSNALAAGFCLIDGICWTDAQANPANGCERCLANSAPQSWTSNDGAACDDGQACTGPDVCLGGTCTSQPIVCADDGNPCTSEACVGGACQTTPLTGTACEDGNPCTVGDACDKGSCVAGGAPKDSDMDGSVDVACPGGDDCDDTSGAVKPGLAEVCDDGLDNDCDSATDEADADCEAPPAEGCTYHTDCYPEGVCAVHKATGDKVCSVPCASKADCAPGAICSKLPGSAQVGFCEDPVPGTFGDGTGCSDGVECQSGICADNVCDPLCLDAASCAVAGKSCHPVGDLAAGEIQAACSTNVAGAKGNGQACTADNVNFGGQWCTSGHCDLMPWPASAWYCAPVCKSEAGCAPAQECNVVIYSEIPNPNALPYDPLFTQQTHDAVTACYTPPSPGGAFTVGTPCTTPAQCSSYKCLGLIPGDPTKYCTSYCTHDAECPAGMQCKLEATTLASTWLQQTDIGSQPPAPGAYSLVRICKFE